MNDATMTINEGMEVFGTDGERIGEVKQVWTRPEAAAPPDPDTVDRYAYGTTDVMGNGATGAHQTAGEMSPPDIAVETVDRRYFRVDQGGMLGIGATELYFPFSAVTDVVRDQSLTVSCTKDECVELYGTKPDFLDAESTQMGQEVLRPPI